MQPGRAVKMVPDGPWSTRTFVCALVRASAEMRSLLMMYRFDRESNRSHRFRQQAVVVAAGGVGRVRDAGETCD